MVTKIKIIWLALGGIRSDHSINNDDEDDGGSDDGDEDQNYMVLALGGGKGTFQKRFSGIRPLRGYPPPPLNGKSV